jgi:carbon storage regulator CsrA
VTDRHGRRRERRNASPASFHKSNGVEPVPADRPAPKIATPPPHPLQHQKSGRLILSRNPGESICIGPDITVTLMEQNSFGASRLCIVAPRELRIWRSEKGCNESA